MGWTQMICVFLRSLLRSQTELAAENLAQVRLKVYSIRRVVEWHFDEMFPRIGFIVTNMTGCSRKVVKLLRGRWLGLLLLADFAIVCSIKSAYDSGSEIWWMSHVGLLIAGLGFVGRSSMLLSTALISIFVLHSLWLVDCLVWLVADQFVLGVTTYLQDARLGVWVATAHHFYLVPLLLISVLDSRRCPRASFPAAVALFIFLSLISRAFLAPADNVNFAFRVDTSLDWRSSLLSPPPMISSPLEVST